MVLCMSATHETPEAPNSLAERIQACSDASLLVVDARIENGDDTPYAHFLCERWGDPRPGHPAVPHVYRWTPSGSLFSYNNPVNMLKSYSRQGTMLNVRWAEGFDGEKPEDLPAALFVSSLDLRTGKAMDWQVKSWQRGRGTDAQTVWLERYLPPEQLPGEPQDVGLNPVRAELTRRFQRRGSSAAVLTLSSQGNTFAWPSGEPEVLDQGHLLVDEVNWLTGECGLELGDAAPPDPAMYQAMRERAAARFTELVAKYDLAA